MEDNYVDISNTRGEAMRKKWQQIIDDGVDPFDRKHVERYIGGKVIFETEHWYVFENDHPYQGRKHQFVIVAQQFFTDFEDLPDEVWLDLRSVKKDIARRYNIAGGGFVIRFGDTSLSGGSVVHLHAQLIVPEEQQQVAAWFGSKKD